MNLPWFTFCLIGCDYVSKNITKSKKKQLSTCEKVSKKPKSSCNNVDLFQHSFKKGKYSNPTFHSQNLLCIQCSKLYVRSLRGIIQTFEIILKVHECVSFVETYHFFIGLPKKMVMAL